MKYPSARICFHSDLDIFMSSQNTYYNEYARYSFKPKHAYSHAILQTYIYMLCFDRANLSTKSYIFFTIRPFVWYAPHHQAIDAFIASLEKGITDGGVLSFSDASSTKSTFYHCRHVLHADHQTHSHVLCAAITYIYKYSQYSYIRNPVCIGVSCMHLALVVHFDMAIKAKSIDGSFTDFVVVVVVSGWLVIFTTWAVTITTYFRPSMRGACKKIGREFNGTNSDEICTLIAFGPLAAFYVFVFGGDVDDKRESTRVVWILWWKRYTCFRRLVQIRW